MPKPKAVVIITAFNEEHSLPKTLKALKKAGVSPQSIVVANDGSADRTSQVARKKGCTVVDLPRNMGKANAFFAGLKKALRDKRISQRTQAVVAMDADMLKVGRRDLREIVSRAASATASKRIEMVVAKVREGNISSGYIESGIRAFSLPAAWRLSSSALKGLPKGYGLEKFLNDLFEKRTVFVNAKKIMARGPFRKGVQRQIYDLAYTRGRLERHRSRMKKRRPK